MLTVIFGLAVKMLNNVLNVTGIFNSACFVELCPGEPLEFEFSICRLDALPVILLKGVQTVN